MPPAFAGLDHNHVLAAARARPPVASGLIDVVIGQFGRNFEQLAGECQAGLAGGSGVPLGELFRTVWCGREA